MVAISLYKGNLHKVPDVPRLWVLPVPKISLKEFRILLRRRARALARLAATTSTPTPAIPTVSSNPSINPTENEKSDTEPQLPQSKKEEVRIEKENNGGDCSEKLAAASEAVVEEKITALVNEEKVELPVNSILETSNKENPANDKRKKEVEEKLQMLNAKKHSLVQLLKQILNAEEELKRRNNAQGIAIRPSVPLQVDTMNDSGSMTRLNTPRLGSDGHLGGEIEGVEADDLSNHNLQSRPLLRMSSISPSSDSQTRKAAFSVVPFPSRSISGVVGSPSRFAPAGQQGQTSNIPSVSVSGTNYIASSPSPAASGGTSAFRDARLPSPWN